MFEIYFSDLTTEAQEALLKWANIEKPEELNWDIAPIAIITKEEEGEE